MSRRLGAEFLGTAWLVFGGCGSAVLAAAFPELGSDSRACRSPSASRC
jgi:aquaporin Z